MGNRSAIEWTEATWNPVTGCSKVSPGCAHCYAEAVTARYAGAPGWVKEHRPWTPANAEHNVRLRPERLEQPLRWRRPRMVFVNSMSDLFHEQVPEGFIYRVLGVIGRAQQHTFQALTKRPERMVEVMTRFYRAASMPTLPNLWLGVSIENQRWADERIPFLLDTPAAVRFLSCEPLLGPVTFRWRPWAPLHGANHLDSIRGGIHWIIVGGESGPKHRPVKADWVRTVRDEATSAGVAFFFKQWGGRTPKAGGRKLDGRTWDEFPAVRP